MPKVVEAPQSAVIDVTTGAPRGRHTDWASLMDGKWYELERGTDFAAKHIGAVINAARKQAVKYGARVEVADRTETSIKVRFTMVKSEDAAPAESAPAVQPEA